LTRLRCRAASNVGARDFQRGTTSQLNGGSEDLCNEGGRVVEKGLLSDRSDRP